MSRLARAYPDVERELMLFRRHYLRARFSGVPPTADEIARLESATQRIRKAMR
ncbi:MAG: hypothetical protein ACQEVA_05455 [Myxococcota bacterium]